MPRKFGRKKAHREHMLRNLITSLILYERITTTEAKAKEAKQIIDHLVTIGKRGDLSARRQLLAYLFDDNAAKKIIEELAPRFKERSGGYTRLYRLGPRLGDAAPSAIIEFLPIKDTKEKTSVKKTASKTTAVLKKETAAAKAAK